MMLDCSFGNKIFLLSVFLFSLSMPFNKLVSEGHHLLDLKGQNQTPLKSEQHYKTYVSNLGPGAKSGPQCKYILETSFSLRFEL